MSVIWDKVWSDLWHHKVRTILAALSIAAGVFALGVIFGMMDQLTPNMNRVHQSIISGHITMPLNDYVDQDTVNRLARVEGVAGVEAYNEIGVNYRLSTSEPWQSGILIMRDEYTDQSYNLLQLKAGEWPQGNSVGVDIRAADYLGLNFGDTVIFERDGSDKTLTINGNIRHHFLTSPDFGDDAHFFIDARGMESFGIAHGEFSEIVIRVTPYSDALAREVASEIKDRLGQEGIGVGATFYNEPDEHWGQQFFDGIYLVLQLLAGVSLLMSVVLIYNTLTALITQQTDQIGIIKAIGGQTNIVVKIYLAGILFYGTLALIVAVPLGAVAAFNITAYFLGIFNIEHTTFQISPTAVIIQTIAAISVPLLAGLWPVLSGARITVREAIASYGLGGSFGLSQLDQAVERLSSRFLNGPKAMTLGNMVRRKGRLALTQMVLIMAGTLFLMVMSLATSINLTVDNDLGRRGYQTQLAFDGYQRIDRITKLAHSSTGVADAEIWFTRPASLLQEGQRVREAGVGAQLIGLPADSTMYRPLITAGRWLQPGDGQVVVINKDTAKENNLSVGDMITLNLGDLGKRQWQVIGLYQNLSIGPNPDNLYAPRETIYQATTKHDVGNRLLIRTQHQSKGYVDTVTQQLIDLYDSNNREVVFDQSVFEDRQFFDNFFAQYIPMLMAPAIILAIVGGIGLMGALSISVVERTKEIGVMRAIGAKTPAIMGMLVSEGIIQGLISWLIAVPLSFVLAQPLAALMGQILFSVDLDYAYNVQAIIVWLIAILGIAVVASIIPARSATKISVRESLAYA
ncbi:MAG: FtsX-like permease family protein [Chloroflexota bacterium]